MAPIVPFYTAVRCYKCKVEFYLPNDHYRSAQRDPCISFYCPHGHQQHFAEGESEETKLRRERDRLAQRVAEWQDEARIERERREAAERRANGYKGHATKLRKRAKAGVCPCCNRQFKNVHLHMQTKHPDFTAEPDEAQAA